MKSQDLFAKLQARWRAAEDKYREVRYEVERKYGKPYYINAPHGQRERIDRLGKRTDATMEAIFAWLDENSPRDWRHGVPAHWACESLTFADATTSGQLATIPPVCFGSYPSDMVRFAAPVARPAFSLTA